MRQSEVRYFKDKTVIKQIESRTEKGVGPAKPAYVFRVFRPEI